MSCILHIETSTDVCSVAVSEDGACIYSNEDYGGPNHAVKLGSFVDEALSFADSHAIPFDAVAVACGPGSYTGLRIGVSMAKGVCYGRDLKLLAVPTLELLAVPVLLGEKVEEGALLCPMIDARRMEVYAAVYDRRLQVKRAIAADIVDENSYLEFLNEQPVYFFGNGADKCREQLSTLPSDFFPTSAEEDTEVEVSLADTESETVTSERSGQQLYRTRLEEIWGGRCAVTGVGVPEVLRASHAKPWKDCETGNERLDGYNGFLLSANLDALFDKFLISFADDGKILISPYLKAEELKALGVTPEMKLRFVDSRHLPYLEYQRNQFLKRIGNGNVIKDENS